MNIFFDTEFTGLKKSTDLVSIGLVTERGEKFYAEFIDFNLEAYNDEWLVNNVFKNTKYLKTKDDVIINRRIFTKMDKDSIVVYGDTQYIKERLSKWIDFVSEGKQVTMVSDCVTYDMMLFINIFGTAFDIPRNICPVCNELNNIISDKLNISILDAFNKSREELSTFGGDINKHNSLYDAEVIRSIYDKLMA